MSDTPRTGDTNGSFRKIEGPQHVEALGRAAGFETQLMAARLKIDPIFDRNNKQKHIMKSLGQIAYEGYFKTAGGKNFIGDDLPTHYNLSPESKALWQGAGIAVENAVLGLFEEPPEGGWNEPDLERQGVVSRFKLLAMALGDLRTRTAGTELLTPDETSALDSAYAQIRKIV